MVSIFIKLFNRQRIKYVSGRGGVENKMEQDDIPQELINEWLRQCDCCPMCSDVPCGGVMCGGLCDKACHCEDLHETDSDYDDYS